jgi:hypothetical protein
MKYFSLTFFAFILFAASCSVSEEPYEFLGYDAPVFYVDAQLDGQHFLRRAGENGYYMFTQYGNDTSYGAINVVGQLASTNNSSSIIDTLSFTIKIYDFNNQSQTGSSPSDYETVGSIAVGQYGFASKGATNTGILVALEHNNRNSQHFSTDLGPQNASATFQITSIEDYLPNEKGQRTKKIGINFLNVTLYDPFGETLTLNGTAVMAYALP